MLAVKPDEGDVECLVLFDVQQMLVLSVSLAYLTLDVIAVNSVPELSFGNGNKYACLYVGILCQPIYYTYGVGCYTSTSSSWLKQFVNKNFAVEPFRFCQSCVHSSSCSCMKWRSAPVIDG